ncbi:glycosyltransferase [Streptomyces actinomycinicus]|uniref:Glycosyltransferase n=1 Tax=Streptomyces actinomycinicus TaxID=1695166 RepID=A0A937JN59_9ACTN|nr:glycosyltransferase [Streptomyces actinomycinicus]MBL1083021.1 glycosyltransferase [Streptomyces actinomycinicus]
MSELLADRQVLLVSTNYAPEHAGIGPYSTAVAEHLAAGGAEVDVLAGMPHYPAWRIPDDYRGRWRMLEHRNGVRVHRRLGYVPARQTAVRRAAYELSIVAHGAVRPPAVRPDVVLSQLPSLAGGVIGNRIARRHGVPHVVVVQDLMGAAAAQSGIAGGGRVASLAAGVESRVLRSAALVGVVHESFVDRVTTAGVPAARTRVVPNWSLATAASGDRRAVRARLGWAEEDCVLLHAGNMGLKQGLEVLIDTARLAARATPRIRVVLMGDGSRRGHLASLAAGVPGVDLLPPAADADFAAVLNAADVLVVTQRASVLDMSLPSKLTSYFSSGRPVVASVAASGGTAGEVRRSGAGVVVPAEDPVAIHGAVLDLARDPARAAALGARGPAYVRERLSPQAGLGRITALLCEALADGPTPRRSP